MKRKGKVKIDFLFFFIILLLISAEDLFSAKVKSNDLQLWSVIEASKSIFENFELEIAEQIRIKNNISKFESNLIDIGLNYSLAKLLKFKLNYRLKAENEEIFNIYIASIAINSNIENFNFIYRLRYDNEAYSKEDDEHYIRNRLTIQYPIKNLFIVPYISGEIFYRFFYVKGDRFNRYRISIGSEFLLSKAHKLSAEYSYDSEFNMKKIDIKRIIGINYSINLDKIF